MTLRVRGPWTKIFLDQAAAHVRGRGCRALSLEGKRTDLGGDHVDEKQSASYAKRCG